MGASSIVKNIPACDSNFHLSCFIGAWYKMGKCPVCKVPCLDSTVFGSIKTELAELIAFVSTRSLDEIDGEAFSKYFSRFRVQPLELLCMIFASIDAFKQRVIYFKDLKYSETLSHIIQVLEKFMEVYKHFLDGAFCKENDGNTASLIPLYFGDRLFYLIFAERSLKDIPREAFLKVESCRIHRKSH